MASTNATCPLCKQPFEPGEGRIADPDGTFHPICFGVHYKAKCKAEGRAKGPVPENWRDMGEGRSKPLPAHRCDGCGMPFIDRCVVLFGDGFTRRYHPQCFKASEAEPAPKPSTAFLCSGCHQAIRIDDACVFRRVGDWNCLYHVECDRARQAV